MSALTEEETELQDWGSLHSTRRRSTVEDMVLQQWALSQEKRASAHAHSRARAHPRMASRNSKTALRLASFGEESGETVLPIRNGFANKNLQNGNAKHSDDNTEKESDVKGNEVDLKNLKLSDLPWGARWLEFADGVSIVGIKYAIDPQATNFRRFVWAFFVVFGIGFMVYQIYERCAYYVSYPTVTNIKYEQKQKLRFPTVTICNENLILHSRAQYNDFDNLIVNIYPPYPDPTFSPNFTQWQSVFRDLRDQNFDWREAWEYWSHTQIIDQWFYGCTFNGDSCTSADFDIVLTPMGYCLQFNGPGEHKKTEIYGEYFGLALTLYTYQSEYLYAKSRGAGFRVLIHDPDAYPLVDIKGARVTPGYVTSMAVSRTEVKLLGSPYGDCKDKEGYNTELCITNCAYEYIAEQCGCQQWYSELNGYRVCDPEELYVCADPAYHYFVANFTIEGFDKSCNCPDQCNEILYSHTYSVSKLSDFALQTIATNLIVEYICTNETDNQTCYYDPDLATTVADMHNNVVDMLIYFEDLDSEELEERAAYTILALLCDIGGAMGLILGSTVLTVAEVSEFFYYLIYDALLFKFSQMRFLHRKVDNTRNA